MQLLTFILYGRVMTTTSMLSICTASRRYADIRVRPLVLYVDMCKNFVLSADASQKDQDGDSLL